MEVQFLPCSGSFESGKNRFRTDLDAEDSGRVPATNGTVGGSMFTNVADVAI